MSRSRVQTGFHKACAIPSLCLLPPVFRRGWLFRTSLPVIAFLQKSAKLKNTTVCLIIQCSPNSSRKRKLEFKLSGFCFCFQRERVDSHFHLAAHGISARPGTGCPTAVLLVVSPRFQRSFFRKRGPLGVGWGCPYRLQQDWKPPERSPWDWAELSWAVSHEGLPQGGQMLHTEHPNSTPHTHTHTHSPPCITHVCTIVKRKDKLQKFFLKKICVSAIIPLRGDAMREPGLSFIHS